MSTVLPATREPLATVTSEHFSLSPLTSPSASPRFKSRLDVFLSPFFKFSMMAQLGSANSPVSRRVHSGCRPLSLGSLRLWLSPCILRSSRHHRFTPPSRSHLIHFPSDSVVSADPSPRRSTVSRDGIGSPSYSQAQFFSLLHPLSTTVSYWNSPFLITVF